MIGILLLGNSMKNRPRQQTSFLLAALISGVFVIGLVLWRIYSPVPLLVISADDLARAIHGWDVTQGKLVPSDLWPPLQFWLQAALAPLGLGILWNALLVNVVASGMTLFVLLLLGREIGLELPGMVFLIGLVVSLPWFVWLSVSGMSEPLFFLGVVMGFYGTIRWHRQNQAWALWLAAGGLLMANLVRFDAWAYTLAFALVMLWCRIRPQLKHPHQWYIVAGVPVSIIVIWLAYMYAKYQNPLFFANVTRDYYLALHPDPIQRLSLLDRVLAQPRDLIRFASLTLVLTLFGVWLQRHKNGTWAVAVMWVAGLFLLMRSTINYTITMNNPERLVIILVILLTPWSALALQAFWHKRAGKLVVVGCLLFIIVPRLMVMPYAPNIWTVAPDGIRIRQHLNELRQARVILPEDKIMIEVVFWDFVLLHAMTEAPAAVIYDRAPNLIISPDGERTLDDVSNPSVFAKEPDRLAKELQYQNVRVLIVADEMVRSKLNNIAMETLVTEKFAVFVLEPYDVNDRATQ